MMRKKIALIIAVCILGLTGCEERESNIVSHNIALEADNFNIRRRVTVINCRSDEVILQCEGCMSISDNSDRLDVIVELPDGSYQKHIIKLNEWTCWTVEQIESKETDKYNYYWNFMPETVPGIKITNVEKTNDEVDK